MPQGLCPGASFCLCRSHPRSDAPGPLCRHLSPTACVPVILGVLMTFWPPFGCHFIKEASLRTPTIQSRPVPACSSTSFHLTLLLDFHPSNSKFPCSLKTVKLRQKLVCVPPCSYLQHLKQRLTPVRSSITGLNEWMITDDAVGGRLHCNKGVSLFERFCYMLCLI